MTTRYWAVQDTSDRAPVAVLAVVDGDGLPRRFVPGQGLVDWPSVVDWTHGGEPGAHRIPTAEALKLIKSGVGRVEPWVVAQQKGDGPTIPVPRE